MDVPQLAHRVVTRNILDVPKLNRLPRVLSKVYIPELLERLSAGKAREAAGILTICVNFTISFVMA